MNDVGKYTPPASTDYADDVSYAKVIRDGVPEYLDQIGVDTEYEIIEDNEKVIEGLINKIKEEADELMGAPKDKVAGELADLMQLLLSIAARENIDFSIVESIRQDKLEKRGAYEKGIFLTRAKKRDVK